MTGVQTCALPIFHDFHMYAVSAPEAPSERAERHKSLPKSSPKHAKTLPGAPRELPRASLRHPRNTKKRLQSLQMSTRSLPGPPKASPRRPPESFWLLFRLTVDTSVAPDHKTHRFVRRRTAGSIKCFHSCIADTRRFCSTLGQPWPGRAPLGTL